MGPLCFLSMSIFLNDESSEAEGYNEACKAYWIRFLMCLGSMRSGWAKGSRWLSTKLFGLYTALRSNRGAVSRIWKVRSKLPWSSVRIRNRW